MKISITMPVYNGAEYLANTLESILNQTYKDWECICVDDGSKDNSLQILKEYAEKDPRFRIYSKTNGGWASKAVKYALTFASGEYWRYISQDDIWSVDLLEKDIKRIEETNADICLPIMIWYDGKDIATATINRSGGYVGYKGNLNAEITGREGFIGSIGYKSIHGFALFKMSLIKDFGYYDYGFNADSYTTRVLMVNSRKIVFSDGIFYYRQNNPNAVTKAFSVMQFVMIDTNAKLRELAIKHNIKEALALINNQSLRDIINLQISLLNHKDTVCEETFKELSNKIKTEWNLLSKQSNFSNGALKLLFMTSFSLFSFSCYALLLKRRISNKKLA